MEGVGSITFDIEQKGQNVIIDIADTGKGIPANWFKSIFKPGLLQKTCWVWSFLCETNY